VRPCEKTTSSTIHFMLCSTRDYDLRGNLLIGSFDHDRCVRHDSSWLLLQKSLFVFELLLLATGQSDLLLGSRYRGDQRLLQSATTHLRILILDFDDFVALAH
jgi:hypothetical protein